MKKILMTLALVFATQMAFCQSFNDVLNKLNWLPGAQAVTLEKEMLKMAASSVPEDAKKTFEKIDKMVMLGIEDASAETQATFLEQVKTLKNNYNKVAEEQEDDQTVFVFADMDDDGNSKGLIVATAGKDQCVFVYIDGAISVDEISQLGDIMK